MKTGALRSDRSETFELEQVYQFWKLGLMSPFKKLGLVLVVTAFLWQLQTVSGKQR